MGATALTNLVNTAKTEFQQKYPGWTVNLPPIVSPAENEYYTKLDLMNQSASTAPNVMYEDTFLVNSDVAAGYLAPLNSYLTSWSGWKEFSPAAQLAGRRRRRKNYGVSMGTDTRGLYYNKHMLAKVGLPVPWHPTTWAQVLAAAETIKAKEPGVTPINVYGGVGEGEGVDDAGLRNVPLRDQQLAVGQQARPNGKRPGPASRPLSASTRRSTPRTTSARLCRPR